LTATAGIAILARLMGLVGKRSVLVVTTASALVAGCLFAALGTSCVQTETVNLGTPCPPGATDSAVYCPDDSFCVETLPAPGDECTGDKFTCAPLVPGCSPDDLCGCGGTEPDGGRRPDCRGCTQLNTDLILCRP
jgi:hypothetical protein